MSVVVRLVLAIGVGLLAGGATIAPHQTVDGWTHQGLDHPPSAVHASLLEHVRWLLARRPWPTASTTAASFVAAPAAVALGALTLALFAFAPPRVWRPARLGVSRPSALLRGEQFAGIVPHAPPRPPFS